ncbi:hypothetical protein KC19_10G185900 [Ceratodon purpureus]|uniref:Uncharacterized protein n=1 Tax=Ceratodon purpureus TaxID=3225 RepID=A0A8T0GU87_CERPU|nr:hypothetical protein KC19_10G185400 [Ceratodon purpureus]KAG0560512.1 hypothetical protein KC19_10G185900 [Ceratodon purpureus]
MTTTGYIIELQSRRLGNAQFPSSLNITVHMRKVSERLTVGRAREQPHGCQKRVNLSLPLAFPCTGVAGLARPEGQHGQGKEQARACDKRPCECQPLHAPPHEGLHDHHHQVSQISNHTTHNTPKSSTASEVEPVIKTPDMKGLEGQGANKGGVQVQASEAHVLMHSIDTTINPAQRNR